MASAISPVSRDPANSSKQDQSPAQVAGLRILGNVV